MINVCQYVQLECIQIIKYVLNAHLIVRNVNQLQNVQNVYLVIIYKMNNVKKVVRLERLIEKI